MTSYLPMATQICIGCYSNGKLPVTAVPPFLSEPKCINCISTCCIQSIVMVYSPIHKAAGSLVTGRSLKNGKMSMGNRHTERPPDPVLYGGRPSGGFVNSAVIHTDQDPDWDQFIGLFPLPDSDSDSDSDSHMDSYTIQDFSIGSDSNSDPLIEMYVWRSVPKMGTVPIWERDPNLNPSQWKHVLHNTM